MLPPRMPSQTSLFAPFGFPLRISSMVYPYPTPCSTRSASRKLVFPLAFVPTKIFSAPRSSDTFSKLLNPSISMCSITSSASPPHHLSAHHRRHRPAPKCLSVKRRIPAARVGLVDVVSPAQFRAEDRHVSERAGRQGAAAQAHHGFRPGCEQFHQAVQSDLTRVYQFLERQRDGGFQTDDAEWASLELLHLFAAGVRGVIGGDGAHGAGGDG